MTTEIQGTLKASSFEFTISVSSFLRWLVDSLCSLLKSCKTTTALTQYVDMLNFLFKLTSHFNSLLRQYSISEQAFSLSGEK